MNDRLFNRFASPEPLGVDELLAVPLRGAPRPSRLQQPLAIKPARAERGAVLLDLHSVGDLLEHLPHRHDDRREARALGTLAPGDDGTVIVEVRSIRKPPDPPAAA